jgi:hypothetical protein
MIGVEMTMMGNAAQPLQHVLAPLTDIHTRIGAVKSNLILSDCRPSRSIYGGQRGYPSVPTGQTLFRPQTA